MVTYLHYIKYHVGAYKCLLLEPSLQSPQVHVTMKSKRPVFSLDVQSERSWEGSEPHSQGSDSILSESPVSRFQHMVAYGKRQSTDSGLPSEL